MQRPVKQPFWISTEFGVPDGRAKLGKHAGVDYAVDAGSNVLAPISGTVTDYIWGQYHGHVAQIFDGQFYHRLMHNSRLLVKPGDTVSTGQVVAKSGATGQGITGPHVHWDIATDKFPDTFKSFIDPAIWLSNHVTKQGDSMLTLTGAEVLHRFLLGEAPSDYTLEHRVGKMTFDEAYHDIKVQTRYKEHSNEVKEAIQKMVEHLSVDMR